MLEISNKRTNNLVIGLVCAMLLLIGLLFLTYRYKAKSEKLKDEIKDYSLRYSSTETKIEFTNPVYSSSLLDDSIQPLTDPAKTAESIGKRRLLNLGSMARGWFKPKTGKLPIIEPPKAGKRPTNETPKTGANQQNQENEEKDKIYSTISDLNDCKKDKKNESEDSV